MFKGVLDEDEPIACCNDQCEKHLLRKSIVKGDIRAGRIELRDDSRHTQQNMYQ